jgi:hypothetical protein
MTKSECRMSNDELPDGWLRAPFSAVTVNPIQRVPSEKEKITCIDIGSVDRITKQVVEPQTMLGKDAPSRARKVIQTGDVLVSTVRPNLNAAVALVESQYNGQFASTGFDVFRSPMVDPRWLFYSVRTPEFLDRMSELVQGALHPAVRSFVIHHSSFTIRHSPFVIHHSSFTIRHFHPMPRTCDFATIGFRPFISHRTSACGGSRRRWPRELTGLAPMAREWRRW